MTVLPQAEIVEVDALWKTIAGAIAAGVGITLAFSVGLLSFTRASEARRDRPPAATVAWGVLAAIGLTTVIAGVILGLIVMTDN